MLTKEISLATLRHIIEVAGKEINLILMGVDPNKAHREAEQMVYRKRSEKNADKSGG